MFQRTICRYPTRSTVCDSMHLSNSTDFFTEHAIFPFVSSLGASDAPRIKVVCYIVASHGTVFISCGTSFWNPLLNLLQLMAPLKWDRFPELRCQIAVRRAPLMLETVGNSWKRVKVCRYQHNRSVLASTMAIQDCLLFSADGTLYNTLTAKDNFLL